MAHIVINSKGQYLTRSESWSEDINSARTYTTKGAAKNSYRQTRQKEPVLIQEIAFLIWGSPETYDPKE